MNARLLIDAIESAGYSAQEYSGRGMFGKTCVGMDVPRGTPMFTAALEVARELMNEGSSEDEAWSLLDELSRMPASQDSLGLGSVVYWPGVPWPQDEEHSCPHPWHEEGGPEACPRCESDGQDEPGCGSCPKCGSLAPQNCGHWDRDGNPAADPG